MKLKDNLDLCEEHKIRSRALGALKLASDENMPEKRAHLFSVSHGKNSIAVRPIPVYSVSTHAV